MAQPASICWILQQFVIHRDVLFAILSAFTEVAVTLAWTFTILGGKHPKHDLDLTIPIDLLLVSELKCGTMDNKTR